MKEIGVDVAQEDAYYEVVTIVIPSIVFPCCTRSPDCQGVSRFCSNCMRRVFGGAGRSETGYEREGLVCID